MAIQTTTFEGNHKIPNKVQLHTTITGDASGGDIDCLFYCSNMGMPRSTIEGYKYHLKKNVYYTLESIYFWTDDEVNNPYCNFVVTPNSWKSLDRSIKFNIYSNNYQDISPLTTKIYLGQFKSCETVFCYFNFYCSVNTNSKQYQFQLTLSENLFQPLH